MGVNSLPKTVTRQRRDCDLNPGPSAPESSTLTTRLPRPVFRRITVASGASPASIVVVRDGCDGAFVDPSVSRDAALRDFSSVGRSVCSLDARLMLYLPAANSTSRQLLLQRLRRRPLPRSGCYSLAASVCQYTTPRRRRVCVCVCVAVTRSLSTLQFVSFIELALRFAPARPRLAPSAHATQRLRPSAGSRQKYLRGPGPLPSP